MAGPASPIDIAPSRHTSSSPRDRTSNLTSQLQQPRIDLQRQASDDGAGGNDPHQNAPRPRQESVHMLGTTPMGARSIPMRDADAAGPGAAYSWGGISMGSFIRDDILMAGTSPYNYNGFQSPSFHSSSYLPKMEANYMKDYVCCDIHLDSMHELLQHYEEAHATQPTQTMGRTPKEQQFPSSRAANAASTAQAVQQQAQAAQTSQPLGSRAAHHPDPSELGVGGAAAALAAASTSPLFSGQSVDQVGTFDGLDDMDMDDAGPLPQAMPSQFQQQAQKQQQQHSPQMQAQLAAAQQHAQNPQQSSQAFQPQPHFGRQQPRGHTVNVNVASAFQGQGLGSAGPTTPRGPASHVLPNNPTVSSVNTPTLTTQTAFSQHNSTPDSSMPGTPADLSDLDYAAAQLGRVDYNALIAAGNFDLAALSLHGNSTPNGGSGPGGPGGGPGGGGNNSNANLLNPGASGTIDDPAKRLLSRQGFGGSNNSNANSGGSAKGFPTPNPAFANGSTSELAKKVREHQLLNGLAGPGGFVGEETKPFRCPVIGCEKAYKNQNGLKYHKQHGHQNQQLKENPDGTFSIVDPATSIPYPGTVGMEKEKPYRCDVCGKRYKNLNGLKYHRQHSPQCNPELKLAAAAAAALPNNVAGMSANVAGAGLAGMDGMGY